MTELPRTVASDPLPLVEIRVHGVSNHGDYSSLGDAHFVSGTPSGRSRCVKVPHLPDHPLWLFNWSLSSRLIGGLWWYVALPFTLLNVAAQTASPRVRELREITTGAPMLAPKRAFDRMMVTLVVIQGLLLSATSLIWTIAIFETIFAHFRLRIETIEAGSGPIVFVASGLIIFGILVNTIWTVGAVANPDRSGGGATTPGTRIRSLALGIGHSAVVAILAVWLVNVNPGQIWGWAVESAGDWHWGKLLNFWFVDSTAPFPVTDPQSPCYSKPDIVGCYAQQDTAAGGAVLFNVLSVSVLIGFVVSAILAIGIFLRALVARFTTRSDRREHSASLAAGALLIFGSWLLLVSFFSAAQLGLFWFLQLIEPVLGGDWYFPHRGQPYFVVLPYQLSPYDLTLTTIMPLLGLLSLAAFTICAALSGVFVRPRHSNFPVPTAKGSASMRYLHRTVSSMNGSMLGVIFATGVLFACFVLLFLGLYGELHPRLSPGEPLAEEELERLALAAGVAQLLVLLVTTVAAITLGFISVSGGNGKLKQTLDIVADILGFWPNEWHPYAGASYRREVMDGLATAIDEPAHARVLLIGHSQGSVLSFWYAAHISEIPNRIDLVTCGSPILTIYAALFPRWFNAQKNEETLNQLSSWTNVWRVTDPIASPIPPEPCDSNRGIHNVEAPDPEDKRKSDAEEKHVRGHSGYWTDRTQTSAVSSVVNPPTTS